ncbi:CCA tRNA nucleotidyltransferase [Acidobacteriota bacterium]
MKIGNAASFEIIKRLREAGFASLYAGGCVRDMLLDIPCKDIDVVTDARPEQVRAVFGKTIEVGAQFGVTLVPLQGEIFEVATFRIDGPSQDGRHPDTVTYSTDLEDAKRRDFTINGMFYDPVEEQVIDYVDGRQGIRDRIIRTIGDPLKRFHEDRLRMIRAVRFAARLGFTIDAGTAEAVKAMASQIDSVSRERVRDEIVKILTEGQAGRGFRLLKETGLLREVLPDVDAMDGVQQPPEYHPEGDVWQHTLKMLDLMTEPTETLALAVLFHDLGKPQTFKVRERIRFDRHDTVGASMTRRIMKNLRFPRKTVEWVESLVREHLKFMNVDKMRPAKLKRFLSQDNFDEHLELHRLDCLGSHGKLDKYEFCRRTLAEMPPEELKPPRLVTGHDLIGLGLSPGPQFSDILKAVEDAQLEGRLKTQEEALEYIKIKWCHNL